MPMCVCASVCNSYRMENNFFKPALLRIITASAMYAARPGDHASNDNVEDVDFDDTVSLGTLAG